MARIAGVDLPNKKRMEFALTYVYGVGHKTSVKILNDIGISLDKRVNELTEDEAALITKELRNYVIEGDLRRQVAMDIKGLMDLGSYRGIRHRRGLPVRGQQTQSNARTRKGKKKTVAGKKGVKG